jgi:hypothetical protein
VRAADLKWLVIGLLLVVPLAEASPPKAGPAPDLEFLEFLGSWETEDGKAVDPFEVDDLDQLEPHGTSHDSPDRNSGKSGGEHREQSGKGQSSQPAAKRDTTRHE